MFFQAGVQPRTTALKSGNDEDNGAEFKANWQHVDSACVLLQRVLMHVTKIFFACGILNHCFVIYTRMFR